MTETLIQDFVAHLPALALVLLVSGGVSGGLMRPLIAFAQKRGWYDIPEARRVHTTPLVRIGGLGHLRGLCGRYRRGTSFRVR